MITSIMDTNITFQQKPLKVIVLTFFSGSSVEAMIPLLGAGYHFASDYHIYGLCQVGTQTQGGNSGKIEV